MLKLKRYLRNAIKIWPQNTLYFDNDQQHSELSKHEL